LFKTYILAETNETLCLIDKHAAHERMLYEQLVEARGSIAAQQLLAPVPVVLSAAEKTALLQNQPILADAGIELDDFGGNEVLVRAIPADTGTGNVEELIVEVAQRMVLNHKDTLNEKTEWVLHSVACRAAVKAGDKTTPQELLKLAEEILNGSMPPFCPHGRPVVLEITRKELEKQFGRLG
ncbi:DNA mismatch repair protein MutL, partial [Ruminococcaceae bacterium OttesenSCG-928-A16]|nr:DNA mismatch repair protein MutL [Ruminococcaceae bacterium OttesenSCG-928-A16]